MNELNPFSRSLLQYYRVSEDVLHPKFATEGSACFDLHAYIPPGSEVNEYGVSGVKIPVKVREDGLLWTGRGRRYLIPTGIIFDIPNGYSLRLHPRSSLSLKRGIYMANSQGIIDSDYVDPVFMPLVCFDERGVFVENGERICQAELIRNEDYKMCEIMAPPMQKTDRKGGMGSTGKF